MVTCQGPTSQVASNVEVCQVTCMTSETCRVRCWWNLRVFSTKGRGKPGRRAKGYKEYKGYAVYAAFIEMGLGIPVHPQVFRQVCGWIPWTPSKRAVSGPFGTGPGPIEGPDAVSRFPGAWDRTWRTERPGTSWLGSRTSLSERVLLSGLKIVGQEAGCGSALELGRAGTKTWSLMILPFVCLKIVSARILPEVHR